MTNLVSRCSFFIHAKRFFAISFALLLLVAAPLAANAQSEPPEFQVNETTGNDQDNPAIAHDSQGRFVVVWESDNQDGDDAGVFARLYNAQAQPRTGEFQVNSHTGNNQDTPSVCMADGDRFVVVWESANQDGSANGIYGQRFNSDGATMSSEFRINSETDDEQRRPDVACDAVGNFVVVWDSNNQDGSREGVYGQRYDRDGNAQGGEFRINSYTSRNQREPSISMDRGGYFAVVWASSRQDGDDYGIFGQLFDNQANPISDEFQVNTTINGDQEAPSVAMDATGAFVVAWQSAPIGNPDVYARRFDAAGNALGGDFVVAASFSGYVDTADVSTDQAGNFLVTYESSVAEGNTNNAYGRLYGSDGGALTSPFIINIHESGDQGNTASVLREDGGFVIAWHSDNQDGDGYGTYGRLFNCTDDNDCDDGLYCNGIEMCDQFLCAEGEPVSCPDDGEWCNGDELCVEEEGGQCASAGDPCGPAEICDEEGDECIEDVDDDDVDDDADDDDADDDADDDFWPDDDTDDDDFLAG